MATKTFWDQKIPEYRKRLNSYGDSPRAMKWKSKQAMELRHRQLLLDIDLEGKSILDVGCGFGDIVNVISQTAGRFSYLGVDMVDDFITIAKRKHPGVSFLVRNYFEEPPKETFDVIISSGALNSNFDKPMEFRKQAIRLMFDHARETLAFNMAGGHPPPPNDAAGRIYYVDSLEILKFCFTLTPRVIFRAQYHPKDFTIILLKQLLAVQYPHEKN